ncbi:hypothetical protein HDU76_011419 [Blyttiomyces sp. JEL0837]|nr:hypothetical protein HDU76_011419 [Blyttiomyces sp. JEL0837]
MSTHFLEYLLGVGADITSQEATVAFYVAINKGYINHTRILLKRGINRPPELLIAVAERGLEKFVNLFVEVGIEVQVGDNAALIGAVGNRHVKVVERLLALGADWNARGGFAMKDALERGLTEMVELLRAAGAP